MTHSGSEPESVGVANRNKGYMRDQFAGALMSNKLLKAERLAEATRPQFTTGAYGFGFQIERPDEARTYGHGGSAPGMEHYDGSKSSQPAQILWANAGGGLPYLTSINPFNDLTHLQ